MADNSTPAPASLLGDSPSGESTALAALSKASAAPSAATPPATETGTPTPPSGSEMPVSTPDATGPMGVDGKPAAEPPREKWDHILDNARKQAREEVEGRFSHLKDIKPEQVRDIQLGIQLLQDLRSNGVEFAKHILAEAGVKLGPEPKAEDLSPDFKDESTGAQFFSADRVMKIVQQEVAKAVGQVRQDIKPVLDNHTQTEMRTAARTAGQSAIDEALKVPLFKENQVAVGEVLSKMDPAMKRKLGPVGSLWTAFSHVLGNTVIPGIEAKVEGRVRETYDKKAAASVGAHPAGASGTGQKPVLNNAADLEAHMERLAQSMSV